MGRHHCLPLISQLLYSAEGANQRVAKVRKPKQNAPRLYAESWGV